MQPVLEEETDRNIDQASRWAAESQEDDQNAQIDENAPPHRERQIRGRAEEAGAVFVKVATLDGNAMLYVPAPQTVYDDSRPIERFFMPISKEPVPEQSVEERLAKELRFDPDAWIVETEDRTGRHFLDLARG